MLRNVLINGHDLTDYGYYLKHRTIGPLEPNTYTVEVPGMNGTLDYTDFFGSVTHKNRTIELEFKRKYDESLPDVLEQIETWFSGQEVTLIFNDDPTHKWVGRCTITNVDDDMKKQELILSVDCKPHKESV